MAPPRRRSSAAPQRLILDSGAVIALSRNHRRARAVLTAAREAGVEVTVPAVVVAETVRGSAADAPVNRVLEAVGEVDVADGATGRIAGGLLGAAGSAATVDAVVVATAVQAAGAVILTGDRTDLGTLADRHPEVLFEAL